MATRSTETAEESSAASESDIYLSTHNVRSALRDAVAHVVSTRPTDPVGAISAFLLRQHNNAVAEAVAPTATKNAEAHGRLWVADLIIKHARDLAAMRECVRQEDHYDKERHDDLFLLRFVLSHTAKGGVMSAAAAAKACIAFRFDHGLDDPMLACGGKSALQVGAVAKFYAAMSKPEPISYYVPDADRGTVLVAVPGLLSFDRILASLSEEEQRLAHRLSNEWLWRHCDEVTRRTGYLTKYIRLIDLSGMTLRGINREFQKRDAKNSKLIEDFYPQLLGAVYICHAPRWMHGVWRGLRRLMPARVVEKVDFVEPLTNPAERKRLLRWIALDHLPRCFGGPCKTWPPPNARFL